MAMSCHEEQKERPFGAVTPQMHASWAQRATVHHADAMSSSRHGVSTVCLWAHLVVDVHGGVREVAAQLPGLAVGAGKD